MSNSFVKFRIDGEDGELYGLWLKEDDVVICACCGSVYVSSPDITILDEVEWDMEVYNTIANLFYEKEVSDS